MSEQQQITRFWPILIAIFCGAFLTVLSTSTINVAVPILMEHFHTDLSSIQWTLTGFLLATGTIAPVTGYLGERFSYKRLYLWSLVGFTLFSLLCAMSWNPTSLILFRTLQGVCSGLVMPATMTIIFQVVPREKQAFAVSLWSLSSMLGPAIGPTLSGWLIENFSWHWLFLMNVPVGILAIILTQRLIPFYRLNVPKSFDLPGLLTCVTGSLSLLIAFSKGNAWGWDSSKTIGLIALGIIALIAFIWRELRAKVPLLNVRVFLNKRFSTSLVLTCIMTVTLYSGSYLTPLFLQNVMHASPLDTGLILLPSSLVMALMMPIVGRLYSRTGPMPLMVIGISLITIGTWMLAHLSLDTSRGFVVLWMIVRNLGISFANMPASNAAMEEIPRVMSGYASSITNWVRNVMGSFSIAVFTAMIGSRSAAHLTELVGSGDKQTISLHAFTLSLNDVYLTATFIAVIGLPICFFIRKKRIHAVQDGAVKA